MADPWDVVSQTNAKPAAPDNDWSVVSTHSTANADKGSEPSFMDRVKAAIFVPKEKRDPSLAQAVTGGATGIPKAIGDDFMSGLSDVRKSVLPLNKKEMMANVQHPIRNELLGGLGGVLETALSPITGPAKSLLGRTGEYETGINRNIIGDVASAFVPIGGEAKAAKDVAEVAEGAADIAKGGKTVKNALKTGEAPEKAKLLDVAADESVPSYHGAKVKRLQDAGVDPTIGQIKGGQARRTEEAHKSDPIVGGAIRAQEQKATDSFNRALYNKVLEPLGMKVSKDMPVGREGIATVGNKLSGAYEKLKPKMSVKPDDELIDGLSEIRTEVGELPPAQQSQFEAILNNRVLHRLGQTGEMDGGTFKTVESELNTIARDYKGSPDPAHRSLGRAIEKVKGALWENLERSSDPGIRGELKNLNKSWAMLTRIEDAATARKGSAGVVSPADLIGAVKKGDKSVRKRDFARGDALLQDFAQDAFDVLGNKVPDSGTPERLAINHHGLLMYALGKATNPLASSTMEYAKGALAKNALRQQARQGTVKNYLLSEQMRASPFVRRAPAASLGQLPQDLNQGAQQ